MLLKTVKNWCLAGIKIHTSVHYNIVHKEVKKVVFDKYFLKRDNILKRRIEIDVSLYSKLKELSEIYDASINKLVNVAVIEMVKNNNVNIYDRSETEITESHNFNIRESVYRELEKLRDRHHLSIYKLVNIAIYNAINS